MVKYCSKCGVENSDIAKFCIKCGNPLKEENPKNNQNNSGYKCPYCNKSIPIGINKCPYCQSTLIEENHNAAIVIGYLFTFLTFFFGILGFMPGIAGIIVGIYLLTRDNQEVHKHGIIMIILCVIFVIISFILGLALASSYYYYY